LGASAPAGAFTPWQPEAPLDQSALPPGGLKVLATVCTPPAAGLPLVLAAVVPEAAGEAAAALALAGAAALVALAADACVAEAAPVFEGLLLLLLLLLLLQLTVSAISALSPVTSSVRRRGRVASIRPPIRTFRTPSARAFDDLPMEL